jgi:Zn-finger nucleic acid-binding protein
MLIMLLDGLVSGFGHALMPIAAVKLFGYTTQQWSQLVAVMGLIGAGVALSLGPVIDRFGAKRILLLTITLVGVHAIIIAQTQNLWQDTTYVRLMLSFWVLMSPVVMVCIIALAMAICSSGNSATQFAIYMSTANLGHSAGSKIYGMVAETSSYVDTYMMLALFVVPMIVILFLYRHKDDQADSDGKKRIRNYAIGAGGSGSGVFFTGKLHCPKCRSDMEQIEIEGTIIDRCSSCKGIWFDEGELEQLSNKNAALAIDTGDASVGKQHNVIDHYRCPRCGGSMEKTFDSQQPHIWYESCKDCQGSFFDAGEFLDISQVTISDFFKRLITPKRE